MKKISLFTLILLLLSGLTVISAQKKTKPAVKRGGYRTIVGSVSQSKVEVEDWKEFESKELNLKLIFPKEPTVSVRDYKEFGNVKVKSSIIQSFINTDYYLVEVREYPPLSLIHI